MTKKAEALAALSTARKMLESLEELTEYRRVLLTATLEFAERKVEEIQEVKRRRGAKPEAE